MLDLKRQRPTQAGAGPGAGRTKQRAKEEPTGSLATHTEDPRHKEGRGKASRKEGRGKASRPDSAIACCMHIQILYTIAHKYTRKQC